MACSEIKKLRVEIRKLKKAMKLFSDKELLKMIEEIFSTEIDNTKRQELVNKLYKRCNPLQMIQVNNAMMFYCFNHLQSQVKRRENLFPFEKICKN